MSLSSKIAYTISLSLKYKLFPVICKIMISCTKFQKQKSANNVFFTFQLKFILTVILLFHERKRCKVKQYLYSVSERS